MEQFEKEIQDHNIQKALSIEIMGKQNDDFIKSQIDEVVDVLNKSFLDGLVSEEVIEIDFKNLDEVVEKARPHKYYKREGSPGKYRYYYTKEDYDKAKGIKTESPDKGIAWSGKDVTKLPVIGTITTKPMKFGTQVYPGQTLDVVEISGDIYIRNEWYKPGVPKIIHKDMVKEFKGKKYEITQAMVKYLDSKPVRTLEEHIKEYAKSNNISFSEDEIKDLVSQYQSMRSHKEPKERYWRLWKK